jgi:hypothetical protein
MSILLKLGLLSAVSVWLYLVALPRQGDGCAIWTDEPSRLDLIDGRACLNREFRG